jgi:hypothetical protein
LPGVLISYWAIKPKENALREKMPSFLKRVLPFPFVAAMIQSLCIMGIYIMNKDIVTADGMKTLMVVSFAAVGFVFFMLAPRVYEGFTERAKKIQFVWLGIIELFVLIIILLVPVFSYFFNVVPLPLTAFRGILMFIAISAVTHYIFVLSFFPRREMG